MCCLDAAAGGYPTNVEYRKRRRGWMMARVPPFIASASELSRDERRQHPRNRVSKDLGLFVRFRPGLNAAVVNLSEGGILVETRQRLHPGTRVELRFFDQHRAVTIRGEVLRSTVSKLMAASIWYRGAIRFEHPLVWPPSTSVLKFPAR